MTDPEDLYVYSFEKLFEKQKYPVLDAVIRPRSQEEITKIMRLAESEGLIVIQRGEELKTDKVAERGLILIDISPPPDIAAFKRRRVEIKECAEKIRRGILKRTRYGLYENLSAFTQSFLMDKLAWQCHECSTCNGFCTVAPYFNYIETWSSKGRSLLIRGLMDGALELSKKIVDVLYTCTLCGSCYMQCALELEVQEAIMATRKNITEKGFAPEAAQAMLKNIAFYDNPMGSPSDLRAFWIEELPKDLLQRRANVLFWVGCNIALRAEETAIATCNVLSKAGVKLATLGEKEGCCGGILILTGFHKEAERIADKIVKQVEETEAEIVITSCPSCYRTFTDFYPNTLGIELPCEVQHTSQFLERLLKEGRLSFRSLKMRITYHDPCELGRHSGIYDAPRHLLRAIPELQLLEMPLNKEYSRCCGGGGGLWAINSEISKSCALLRIKDALPLGIETLVTACPQCYKTFLYATIDHSIKLEICDLTQILEKAQV